MPYDTGNPLGSTDFRDLSDNAANFDKFANGESPAYADRFGVLRRSISGMNADFLGAQDGRAEQFQAFLDKSNYSYVGGDYAAGLQFVSRAQYTARNGVLYVPSATMTLPYTTTGVWANEQSLFKVLNADSVLRQDLAASNGDTLIGATLPDGSTGTVDDYLKYLGRRQAVVLLEKPGVDRTAEILAAIQSMRANPASILDDIGGTTITAYSSGKLILGPGVFIIQADQLVLTQDLGLTIEGQGSRRTNNAVHAPTTLLVSGTSAGIGVQFKGSGARGGQLKDLDLCYADANFTGDLIDVYNCPGVTLKRVFVGTYGVTGSTRQQTANSAIRTTYDEFLLVDECVFDGAKMGWWSDDVRASSNGNTFGGSNTTFKNCVWYDFTQKMVYHRGNRTRIGVTFANCTFNPINVNVQNSLDMRNVEGLDIDNCHFAGSVSNYSVNGWVYIENSKGQLRNSQLDDNCPAGTISGQMDVSNNRIYCTTGWNFTGGVITGKGNTYSKGTAAVSVSPTIALTLDIGPDYFKADVGYSYQLAASTLVDGRINYALSQDGSTNKIANSAINVSIQAVGTPITTVTGNRSLTAKESGTLFVASGSAAQTIGLPAPTPGVKFSILKSVAQSLTITATGSAIYTGSGSTKTVATSAAADVGGSLTVESIGTSGWRVSSQVGTWSYS